MNQSQSGEPAAQRENSEEENEMESVPDWNRYSPTLTLASVAVDSVSSHDVEIKRTKTKQRPLRCSCMQCDTNIQTEVTLKKH